MGLARRPATRVAARVSGWRPGLRLGLMTSPFLPLPAYIHLFSDPHFGRGKGTGDLAPFVERVRRNPGPVVIPGDLTGDGHRHEYVEAERAIERLMATGCPVAITPGNHDIRSSRWRERWARLMNLVRAHPGVVACTASNSIVRYGAELFVLLRGVHRTGGHPYRIRQYQLAWAREQLLRMDLVGTRLHLVTHASMWDWHGGWRKAAMRFRERTESQLLNPFGFHSVIHGHVHARIYEAAVPLPHTRRPIAHVGVPTLYAGRGAPNRASMMWTPGKEPVVHRS